jgi:hypothetical protein
MYKVCFTLTAFINLNNFTVCKTSPGVGIIPLKFVSGFVVLFQLVRGAERSVDFVS